MMTELAPSEGPVEGPTSEPVPAPLRRWERVVAILAGVAFISFSIGGTITRLPEVPVTAFLLLGAVFFFVGLLGMIPDSLRLAENEVRFRRANVERAIGEAGEAAESEPVAAVGAINAVLTANPDMRDDKHVIAYAAQVYESAVLSAIRSAIADPEVLVEDVPVDDGVDAILKADDGRDVAIVVKYSHRTVLSLGTILQNIRKASRAGYSRIFIISNAALPTRAIPLIKSDASGDQMIDYAAWLGTNDDTRRVARRLRRLGVVTRDEPPNSGRPG